MATQDHSQDRTSTQQPTLNLNSILIGSAQPAALVEFYAKLFGKWATAF